MTVYWLSYRIEEDLTGDQRRKALVDEIAAQATPGLIWHETTSFIVFDSSNKIDGLAQAFRATIDPRVDHFLIREMEAARARICGRIRSNAIFQLMSRKGRTYLVRVP